MIRNIGLGALAVGSLLLLAPWVPPNIALFAMVFAFAFGVLAFYGTRYVVDELVSGWREAAPDDEEGEELSEAERELERLQRRYQDDESFGADEFEREVESVFEEHGVLFDDRVSESDTEDD